ncbi:MAG TPA: TadE/TadG family type IV pilus assembly protein [Rhizomicrobium sp.]|nr:TadE/TadG family type IV pilus assembly protein [Rhizomicrobium sp.]
MTRRKPAICGENACVFATDVRGTSAVEFAVIAPVLFGVLFGIVAFGAHYAARIALTYAAAEGGRAALAGLSDGERESLARTAVGDALNALSPLVAPHGANVTVSLAQDGDGHRIDITISYNDGRFARMPFLPDLSQIAPVTVEYRLTDPLG